MKKQKTRSHSPLISSADGIPKGVLLSFTGIVSPSHGGGGGKSGREKTWTFSATLEAWRIDNGPVVREPILILDYKLDDIALAKRMKQFPRWGIVCFKAKLAKRG